MKNIILSISSIVLGIGCLCLVCVLLKQQAHSMELSTNVADAVKNTVKAEVGEEAVSREEFLAGFMERLAVSLKTDSRVQVLAWDEEQNLQPLKDFLRAQTVKTWEKQVLRRRR